jgi:hypothetical protein
VKKTVCALLFISGFASGTYPATGAERSGVIGAERVGVTGAERHGVVSAERSGDFAYAVPLDIDGNGALYQLELPQSVYEGAVHGDLSDLAVFNGGAEAVPFALKPPPSPATTSAPPIKLPYFPLQGSQGNHADALDIRAERNTAGTIVRVISASPKTNAQRVLLGYLVDASSSKVALKVLELDWNTDETGFSGVMRVEGSNDLIRWSTLASQAPIVNLEFGGQRLVQKSVDLASAQYKYLRLSWPVSQKPLKLTSLRGRPADITIEPSRQWKQVRGVSGTQPGDYEFDLGGHLPVDRLRVVLPEDNTLVSAQFLARDRSDQPWQPISAGVLYHLRRDGQDLTNSEFAVVRGSWRYWLLRVDQKGGGLGHGVPTLEAGWVPQQLVFVARGSPPFLLAYGSASANPSMYPIETVVPGWRGDSEIKITTARTGAQQVLAGTGVLKQKPDYKTFTLWGSLVVGVLLLAWMAWRLTRDVSGNAKGTNA